MPTKKITLFLFALILLNLTLVAQAKNFLNVTVLVKNNDGKQSLKLFNYFDTEQEIRGFIGFPNLTNVIYGSLNDDFSFLNDRVFGGVVNFLLRKWADNKFPINDIESMTDGCDVSKALAFRIKPIFSKTNDDSVTYAIKFAVINRKNSGTRELDGDYNVKLFYKLIHTMLGKSITPDFLKQYFPDHEISFHITKQLTDEQSLKVNSAIYDEVKKSLKEAYIENNMFDFGIQLGVLFPTEKTFWRDSKFFAHHQQIGFEKKYIVKNTNGFDSLMLSKPVYYSCLEFPFNLLNREKAKKYEGYKSKNTLLNSRYEFILIPIEVNKDTLLVDVITAYNKLSLDDSIQRWSPFKKRIKLFLSYGGIIEMPKENWSAVFTRRNESYEVYGYSDYERFVNEQLFIELEKIYEEK